MVSSKNECLRARRRRRRARRPSISAARGRGYLGLVREREVLRGRRLRLGPQHARPRVRGERQVPTGLGAKRSRCRAPAPVLFCTRSHAPAQPPARAGGQDVNSHGNQAFVVSKTNGVWGKAKELPGIYGLSGGESSELDSICVRQRRQLRRHRPVRRIALQVRGGPNERRLGPRDRAAGPSRPRQSRLGLGRSAHDLVRQGRHHLRSWRRLLGRFGLRTCVRDGARPRGGPGGADRSPMNRERPRKCRRTFVDWPALSRRGSTFAVRPLQAPTAGILRAPRRRPRRAEALRAGREAAVEQPAGELADLRGVVDADVERRRTAADREVGVAKLRRHRPRDLAASSADVPRPRAAMRRSSSCRRSRSVRSRSNVFSTLIEIRSGAELEATRIDAARAVAQHRADAARQQRGGARRRRAPRDRRSSRCPRASRRSSRLRPDAGQPAHVERREERRLLPGRTTVSPPGLRASLRDLRDDLARRDAERAREARPGADGRLHGLGDPARLEEVPRDLADVEVALVEPGLLDGRDDPAHGLPDVRASTRGRASGAGRTKTACGQRRSASAQLIAEWMPNRRAT